MSPFAKPTQRKNPRRNILLVQKWWSDRLLRGVAQYAVERNWALNCEMGWDPKLPKYWKGDGMIVYAARNREILNFVRKSKVPIVDLSSWNDAFKAPKVTISNEGIVKMAIAHLRHLGFENIGCVIASHYMVDRLRYIGFEREASRTGKPLYRIPLKGLGRHLAKLPKPIGLVTSKDQHAAEVIRLCQDLGYAVPEEIAVLGVNDTPILCDLAPVPITSIDPNFERNGYEAAALLDRLIDGEPPPAKPIIIPPQGVTLRRSTDTLFVPDLDTAHALRYLRDHFLTLKSVQEVAGGSLAKLRKIQKFFRQYTGRTLIQELVRLRIEHAKKLLQNTDEKIDEVAHQSGFANRTHFVRMFHLTAGVSPKEFRKADPMKRVK